MSGRIAYYGGIVKNGLVLDLDAGKKDSYNRVGTSWNDISGNGNNGTLTNFGSQTTYDSNNAGSIVFDGLDDCVILQNFITSSYNSLTFNFWIKSITQKSYSQSILGKDTNTGNLPHLLIRRLANSDTLSYNVNNGISNDVIQVTDFFTGYDNIWMNIQITANYNTGDFIFYRNGQFFFQRNITSIFPNTNAVIYLGAFVNPGFLPFYGNMSLVSLYNRVLSASEVLQNYNALKGRYL